jgi:hypothetical protein
MYFPLRAELERNRFILLIHVGKEVSFTDAIRSRPSVIIVMRAFG